MDGPARFRAIRDYVPVRHRSERDMHIILNCDMAPAAQKILDAIRAIQCIDWTPAVRALRKASPRKWQ